MRLSREFKVGIVVTCAIAALVWGINYLKGTDLFTDTQNVYAVYDNIDGLVASNRVVLNGYRVGQVKKIRFLADNSGRMVATLAVNSTVFISRNSIARIISSDFFGGKAIQLELGNDPTPVKEGDTLVSELKSGIEQQLGPVKNKAESLITSLDSVATSLNKMLDEKGRNNLSEGMAHLNNVLKNLEHTTASFNQMMSQDGSLNKAISNIESVSANIKNNNEKIDQAIDNFSAVSDSLASANLASTINSLSKSTAELNTLLERINKGEGSLGKMFTDDSLYTNLNHALDGLDKLLIDMKANPKRYVHFSVFGKKGN